MRLLHDVPSKDQAVKIKLNQINTLPNLPDFASDKV